MTERLNKAVALVRGFSLDECQTAYLQSVKVGGNTRDQGQKRRLWAQKVLGLNEDESKDQDLNWIINVQLTRAKLVGELNRSIIRCRGE